MTDRHLISFPMPGRRFNFRVAAVIIKDGHVLVCREDDDDYVMLPGGRIELGEDSRIALEREIAEELVLPAGIGDLLATSENFYARAGEDFHELGFFYTVTLPGQGPTGVSPWLARHDEGHYLQFHWVRLDDDSLEKMNLLPKWLPNFLRQERTMPVHLIHHDRP